MACGTVPGAPASLTAKHSSHLKGKTHAHSSLAGWNSNPAHHPDSAVALATVRLKVPGASPGTHCRAANILANLCLPAWTAPLSRTASFVSAYAFFYVGPNFDGSRVVVLRECRRSGKRRVVHNYPRYRSPRCPPNRSTIPLPNKKAARQLVLRPPGKIDYLRMHQPRCCQLIPASGKFNALRRWCRTRGMKSFWNLELQHHPGQHVLAPCVHSVLANDVTGGRWYSLPF